MKQAVEFLYGIPKFTKKHSLAHTQHFMELLGNPGNRCKVIHVAGSNGKGSVCCFLYHMLLSEGKTAGLFTSPHLIDVRERFQLNGDLCGEDQFLSAYARVKKTAEELERKGLGYPTFFEFIFAMGMVIFEEAGVEYIVLETGLGGRLDATNSVAHPVLCIITSISLEHTEILGDTIAQIAGEKAGIIKTGVPVVFDANESEAAVVIADRARELHSPCTVLEKKCTGCWNLRIILLIFRFRLRMIRKQDGRFREQQIIRWKMRHWRFLPCAFCSSSIRQHFPVILLNSSFIQA